MSEQRQLSVEFQEEEGKDYTDDRSRWHGIGMEKATAPQKYMPTKYVPLLRSSADVDTVVVGVVEVALPVVAGSRAFAVILRREIQLVQIVRSLPHSFLHRHHHYYNRPLRFLLLLLLK